jgi:arginine N-succinyltransferase
MQLQDFLIRPIRESDLPALIEIVQQLGPGFTSLPNDLTFLEKRVSRSMESFSEKIEKPARFYLFVLESIKNKKIIGTSAIQSSVAYPWPFYNYKLSMLAQYSQILNKYQENKILHLVSDYQGSAELGGLFLDLNYRGSGAGTFLSRSRCLFIAEFPALFPDMLIAEMRGICDQAGNSPFWEAVGRPFFGMDFRTADLLRATEGNLFISELMPKYAVYVALLPQSARDVIGQAHEKALPALHVLKKEGFQFRNYVDILNAGPTVEVAKKDLRTLKESQLRVIAGCKKKLATKELWMLCNRKLDYRATIGSIELTDTGEVYIEENTADVLKVSVGDTIRYSYIR